jgi:hypothetical protein
MYLDGPIVATYTPSKKKGQKNQPVAPAPPEVPVAQTVVPVDRQSLSWVQFAHKPAEAQTTEQIVVKDGPQASLPSPEPKGPVPEKGSRPAWASSVISMAAILLLVASACVIFFLYAFHAEKSAAPQCMPKALYFKGALNTNHAGRTHAFKDIVIPPAYKGNTQVKHGSKLASVLLKHLSASMGKVNALRQAKLNLEKTIDSSREYVNSLHQQLSDSQKELNVSKKTLDVLNSTVNMLWDSICHKAEPNCTAGETKGVVVANGGFTKAGQFATQMVVDLFFLYLQD